MSPTYAIFVFVVRKLCVILPHPVATAATALPEDGPATNGAFTQRAFPLREIPAIESGIRGEQSPLVAGQGHAHGFGGQALLESRLEQPIVVPGIPDGGQHEANGGIGHLVGLQQRLPDLVLQAVLPAVVEQYAAISHVQQTGGIALDEAALYTHRGSEFHLGEALLRHVAHGTGQGAVEGQAPVEEQLAAQVDFRPAGGVSVRHRQRRQAQRR